MLQYEKKNGILLVRLSGELDHHCAAAIREELDALIDRSDARRLVFDLSGLTFMDSSGIGMMNALITMRASASFSGQDRKSSRISFTISILSSYASLSTI